MRDDNETPFEDFLKKKNRKMTKAIVACIRGIGYIAYQITAGIVTYKKDERRESAVDLVKCLAIEQMNTSGMIIRGVDVRYKVVYVVSPEIKDAVADSIWNKQKSVY